MRRAALVILAAVALPSVLHAQAARLVVGARPQLVECRDSTCMSFDVHATDAQGRTVPLSDTEQFQVHLKGHQLRNVYPRLHKFDVAGDKRGDDAPVPRVWLVLFDVSGSMNQSVAPPAPRTRFQEAIGQLPVLYQNFRDNIDQMAIAPFSSVGVADGIRQAFFETTKSGIQRRIMSIATPHSKNNTGLYSAVVEGLNVLQPKKKSGARVTLVVFTDGENDVVTQPSDKNLLGNHELDTVRKAAADVGVTIYAVGFGAGPRMFNEQALRQIAYPDAENYLDAKDPSRLSAAFSRIADVGNTFVRLVAGPLQYRREDLMGECLEFEIRAGRLTGRSPQWCAPSLGAPSYERDLTPQEKGHIAKSFIFDAAFIPPQLFRLLVVVTYGGVLLVLWFGLPRLIWPERYAPKPPVPAGSARPSPKLPPRPSGAGARTPSQRPEVTIPHGQPPRTATPAAGAARRTSPPPPKPNEPPPRPAEALGPREATDATVFIPPKKPGGRSS